MTERDPDTVSPTVVGNLGGVTTPTILNCPRCDIAVILKPNRFLRLPNDRKTKHCHEIVRRSGAVEAVGGHR
jgi:hypothetical protein